MRKYSLFFYLLLIFIVQFSAYSQVKLNHQTKAARSTDIPIESIDRELYVVRGIRDSSSLWIDAKSLTVEGMGWTSENMIEDFTRLPNKYQDTVTENVWSLSRHSAGIHIRFIVKGTREIKASWVLRAERSMPHMTLQAINGLDLYVKHDGQWVFAGTGKPAAKGVKHESLLTKNLNHREAYECMLYLPLYNGVASLELGFDTSAVVQKAPPFVEKPMVFYGTSILHGCSASRSGMSFSSMLGRKYNTPVVNLGFSGNGLTEPYFGQIMGEIDASIFVVDCLPNMYEFTKEEVTERTIALVRNIRKYRPVTPVVLVEDRTHTHFSAYKSENIRRAGLKSAYELLSRETQYIYYVEGENLLGNNNEATADGSHPSDLGMYYYFQALDPVIGRLLKKND